MVSSRSQAIPQGYYLRCGDVIFDGPFKDRTDARLWQLTLAKHGVRAEVVSERKLKREYTLQKPHLAHAFMRTIVYARCDMSAPWFPVMRKRMKLYGIWPPDTAYPS